MPSSIAYPWRNDMTIANRSIMFQQEEAGWKNPYVTDGLVAMWDGIWNAGPGKHDPNATVWKDLISGAYDMSVNIGRWNDDNFYVEFSNSTTMRTSCDTVIDLSSATLETVGRDQFKMRDKQMGFHFSSTINKGFQWFISRGDYYICQFAMNGRAARLEFSDIDKVQTISGITNGTTCSAAYVDGVLRDAAYIEDWGGSSKLGLGRYGYSLGDRFPQGYWYCIRLYSRALTAEEVAANYAVDAKRFNLTGGGVNA